MVGLMGWSVAEQGWRKGPWTPEEDKLLTEYVSTHGEGRWSSVARASGLNRSGKSCRLRWVNYLRPGLKRGQLTPQEEGIIIELHAIWGNKWSTIARYLPGRTDNEIKNYWRTHFKKKASPFQKQHSKKAEAAKQIQVKQEDNINNETNKALACAEAIVGNGEKREMSIQDKQEMGSMNHPAAMKDGDDQWLPVMYEDVGASWPDTNGSIIVDGLWGGLWGLDDDPQVSELCNKMAIQNQASANLSGVDYNLYSGGYIF